MVRQSTVMRFGPTLFQGVTYGPSTNKPIISLSRNDLASLCSEDLRVLNEKIFKPFTDVRPRTPPSGTAEWLFQTISLAKNVIFRRLFKSR
jgi:hypothetical protein